MPKRGKFMNRPLVNIFPVVGTDAAKEFCYFAVLSPDSKVFVNPTKIMNDESGWDDMLKSFKKAEETFNESPTILLESTGHFSESLVNFLIKNDYRVFLINPQCFRGCIQRLL